MDAVSLKILSVYSSRQRLTLIELGAIMNASPVDLGQYVLRLKKKSYLCVDPDYEVFALTSEDGAINPNTPLQITIDGKEALEDHERMEQKRTQDSVRYGITTAIAVAALFISLIGLLAQLGVIPLPRL